MIDDIDAVRRDLNLKIVKLVGPMSAIVLQDLIKQLPTGYHVQGWFLPNHKAIQKDRGLKSPVYFLVTNKLMDAELIYKQRKAMGARRGVWYKINFDKMTDMIREGNDKATS